VLAVKRPRGFSALVIIAGRGEVSNDASKLHRYTSIGNELN